jgi:hypothetical protein
MKKFHLLIIVLACGLSALAQQPFEKYGYKVKVATLSKGKYVEHFDQDTIVQIGTVMFNRRSGKIVSFVEYDTAYGEYSMQPELISRWMSQDPLAEEFYSESPYNFTHDNPIRYNDPDGRAPGDPNDPGILERIVLAFTLALDKAGTILNQRNGNDSPTMNQNIVAASNFVGETLLMGQGHMELMQPSSSGSKVVSKVDDAVNQTKSVADDAVKVVSKVDDVAPQVTKAYARPSNATTPAQREAVQGQACVDCGATGKMFADHKKPLVKEYYETGTINADKMRDINSVQPQCQNCSGRQGAELKKYSQEQKKKNGIN